MVSLFRHLNHVTQNCANLNNTNHIFLDFKNKHIFYNDDNDDHLPITVYSGIKPSRGPEFILNAVLSLGIFYTDRELLLNETLGGCFCNAKLIREEDDTESMYNYSNLVMNILVNNQLMFSPKWSTYD